MDLIALLQSLGIPPSVVVYVTTAITVATGLDAVLPHWTAPPALAAFRKAIGFVAISFGHGKPAGAVATSQPPQAKPGP